MKFSVAHPNPGKRSTENFTKISQQISRHLWQRKTEKNFTSALLQGSCSENGSDNSGFRFQFSSWAICIQSAPEVWNFGRTSFKSDIYSCTSAHREPCAISKCLAANKKGSLSGIFWFTMTLSRSFKTTPIVRVIAWQLSGKNCLAAICTLTPKCSKAHDLVRLRYGGLSAEWKFWSFLDLMFPKTCLLNDCLCEHCVKNRRLNRQVEAWPVWGTVMQRRGCTQWNIFW